MLSELSKGFNIIIKIKKSENKTLIFVNQSGKVGPFVNILLFVHIYFSDVLSHIGRPI